MISKKIIAITLASALFFSGCSLPFSSSDEPEETIPPVVQIPEVLVEKTKRTAFVPELSLSGTITAKDEITIASEVTGTVAKVLKKEGDKISEGTAVMNLESQTNLIKASFSSAQIALQNTQKAFNLTKKSVTQNIKKAQIGVKNAEIAISNASIAVDAAKIKYEKIKDSEKYSKDTTIAQSSSTEKELEIAKKNKELAKKTYADILENQKQTEIQIIENMANIISQTLIPLRSDMTFADTLLGASEFKKHDNDSFEVYLSGTSGNLMKETQNEWNKISPLLEELEIRFSGIEKYSYTSDDKNDMKFLLSDTEKKAKQVRGILRKIEKLLINAVNSETLSLSQIAQWKQTIEQQQKEIEQYLQSLSQIKQTLADFEIQSPQQISQAEIQIAVMDAQLLANEEKLAISKNSQNSQNISIDSDILSAKNAYLSAKNAEKNAKNALSLAKSQLELVKIQGELSIQSALAQMDSAQAAMDQAALSLSKLTILSGITGTVSKVLAFDGDTVSPGTPLLIISDFSALELVTNVSVEESFLLKKGQKAIVKIDGIEKDFIGKVSIVYPEADKVTRRVRVEILIPNTSNIPANVFATAKIQLPKEKPQVFIPVSALISQNPPTIFLAEKDKKNKTAPYHLVKKEIEIGEEKRGVVPVLKGLRPNQFIVIEKYRSLFDGDEVIIKEKGEKKGDKKENKKENKEEDKKDSKENKKENSNASDTEDKKSSPSPNPTWSNYATPKPVTTPSSTEGQRKKAELESEIDKRLREKAQQKTQEQAM